jgi:hypothetical protein
MDGAGKLRRHLTRSVGWRTHKITRSNDASSILNFYVQGERHFLQWWNVLGVVETLAKLDPSVSNILTTTVQQFNNIWQEISAIYLWSLFARLLCLNELFDCNFFLLDKSNLVNYVHE